MPVDLLSAHGAILMCAAVVVGMSKTSVGGLIAVAVALFAIPLPAKESTAAVLLLLIVGDLVAVSVYRKEASWPLLRRLVPSVLPGIVAGAVFVAVVNDAWMRFSIGVLLLTMVVLQVVTRFGPSTGAAGGRAPRRWSTVAAGGAAGFATMTANAAAPVMALYLLACRVDKRAFIGTNAWFFLLVNLVKAPFSLALGLFPASTLSLTVVLAPFVVLGAGVGAVLVHRMSQRVFENVALVVSALAAVPLLVG
ncbi:sulfite exporter TauE/SafE family protein [Austwickia chelonae]|uniref:sulfite exporter TauE/SafE family protein n=1 Tax=Austwickia chelonae TaxID=100225 RepID=UPI0002E6A1A7|nr:sulfite exporter TauE/SafE family protein [Austwickia chelonae]